MSEPTFVAETLAWCNERRAEKGMEPLDRLPKGRRGNRLSCPCGAATGLSVGRFTVRTVGMNYICDAPEPVAEFVDAFDSGHLPQYDEDVPA